jgi:hypothetical protein
LGDYGSDDYRRLIGVLDDSWDMVEAMQRRMAQLIESSESN